MDYEEKFRTVRRILSGTLYTKVSINNESLRVVFQDPSLSTMTEADFVYSEAYHKSTADGLPTLEDTYEILTRDGKWTPDGDTKIALLQKQIKDAQKSITALKFHKTQQRAMKDRTERLKTELISLMTQKSQLYDVTAEAFADQAKRRFIISRICIFPDHAIKLTVAVLNRLIVCYYSDNGIEDKSLRQLARSDPWRTYWTVAKDTGTPLLDRPLSEMTDLQYALIRWSKIYDFAFESTNRPDDAVIESDEQFDAWYVDECDRLESEAAASRKDSGQGQKNGIMTTMIPADKEGARDVYNMNDPAARNTVRERQKLIEAKKEVKETELPDVKRQLRMDMNKMAGAGITRRGSK